jgi:hypothetical protein
MLPWLQYYNNNKIYNVTLYLHCQRESILRELNLDKNIKKLRRKIYATGIAHMGNRLKLIYLPSLGIVTRPIYYWHIAKFQKC